jgi:hypothetical protein
LGPRDKENVACERLQSASAGGAPIVYERLIDDERRAHSAGLLASLHMLIMTAGGFDFTAADCMADPRSGI